MKVTLAMIMSADGKTTIGDAPGANYWASPEDQEHFRSLIAGHDCIVMGSSTFEAARSIIRPSAAKLRIILTRNPERWAKDARLPGLEFSAESPEEIIEGAVKKGYKKLLLVGGAETNERFLDAGLVDEIFLTIEPRLFGTGLPLTAPLEQSVDLLLISSRQLNTQGTLLNHYEVVKD